jgi:hypothetical protein
VPEGTPNLGPVHRPGTRVILEGGRGAPGGPRGPPRRSTGACAAPVAPADLLGGRGLECRGHPRDPAPGRRVLRSGAARLDSSANDFEDGASASARPSARTSPVHGPDWKALPSDASDEEEAAGPDDSRCG